MEIRFPGRRVRIAIDEDDLKNYNRPEHKQSGICAPRKRFWRTFCPIHSSAKSSISTIIKHVAMPYLIDGHNLIPKIHGMNLRAIDDEKQLIQKLQVFQRQSRKKVEVFFDGAPPGESRVQTIGGVKAHFVRTGKTADHAIMDRLHQLGNNARNWTVVSSDRQVQNEARSARASVLSSEEFAEQMLTSNEQASQSSPSYEDELSPAEVDEWLQIFKNKKNRQG